MTTKNKISVLQLNDNNIQSNTHLGFSNQDYRNLFASNVPSSRFEYIENKGIAIKGKVDEAVLETKVPIHENKKYHLICEVELLNDDGGGSTIYIGHDTLDKNFNSLRADKAVTFNYSLAYKIHLSDSDPNRTFEAVISGFNSTDDGNNYKFDPSGSYFNIGFYTRNEETDNSGVKLLIKRLEIKEFSSIIEHDSGNVGIGTTSPDTTLQLEAAGGASMKLTSSTTNGAPQIGFSEYTSENNVVLKYNGTGTGAGNYFAIFSETAGWAAEGTGLNFIPENGRVGIGTTSPSEKLEVNGNIKCGDFASSSIYNVNASTPITIYTTDVNSTGLENITGIKYSHNDSYRHDGSSSRDRNLIQAYNSRTSYIYAGIYLRSYNEDGTGIYDIQSRARVGLGFKTRNSNVYETRMSIKHDGNVGIGTNDPQGALDIKRADNQSATINIYGDSQGTGRLYVGQSLTYGGGIEYNGDNSPSTTGAGSDYITLWRRNAGNDYWTARNRYNSDNWEFRGNLTCKNLYMSGDNSFTRYGPNNSNGILYVGAGGNQYGSNTASIVVTNGNLHLDSATGRSLYLNYYNNTQKVYLDGHTHIRNRLEAGTTNQSNGIISYAKANYAHANTNLTIEKMSIIGQVEDNNMFFYWRDNFIKYGAYISNMFTVTFTGQHASYSDTISVFNLDQHIGKIVVSTGTTRTLAREGKSTTLHIEQDINNAHPVIEFSSKPYQKSVYGVVSNYNDTSPESNDHGQHDYDNKHIFFNDLHGRIRVNSIGEGMVWVVDENGPIENGDYIVSSSVMGYGMRQEDDIMRSCTVAKSTIDCDFTLRQRYRLQVSHTRTYDDTSACTIKISYSDEGITQFNDYVDTDGSKILENIYDIRYVLPDSSEISKEEYDTRKGAGETVYVAALIACTYHCG